MASTDKKIFIPYAWAMKIALLSNHKNQLARRRRKYPQHFIELSNTVFISLEFLGTLPGYQDALKQLRTLKN